MYFGLRNILSLRFIKPLSCTLSNILPVWRITSKFPSIKGLTLCHCLSLDAVREVRKYSAKDLGSDAKLQPNMFDHLHMKLFRAQRNLYISGFAVFLWLWVFVVLYWYHIKCVSQTPVIPTVFLQGHEASGHLDKPTGISVWQHGCSSAAGWQR